MQLYTIMTNEELTTDESILAYQLLKDQGLPLQIDTERMIYVGNITKMGHAIRIVNEFASGLPEQVKIDCIRRYFKSFHDIEAFRDMFKPSIKRELEKQLISEEEEQKRMHKQKMMLCKSSKRKNSSMS